MPEGNIIPFDPSRQRRTDRRVMQPAEEPVDLQNATSALIFNRLVDSPLGHILYDHDCALVLDFNDPEGAQGQIREFQRSLEAWLKPPPLKLLQNSTDSDFSEQISSIEIPRFETMSPDAVPITSSSFSKIVISADAKRVVFILGTAEEKRSVDVCILAYPHKITVIPKTANEAERVADDLRRVSGHHEYFITLGNGGGGGEKLPTEIAV